MRMTNRPPNPGYWPAYNFPQQQDVSNPPAQPMQQQYYAQTGYPPTYNMGYGYPVAVPNQQYNSYGYGYYGMSSPSVPWVNTAQTSQMPPSPQLPPQSNVFKPTGNKPPLPPVPPPSSPPPPPPPGERPASPSTSSSGTSVKAAPGVPPIKFNIGPGKKKPPVATVQPTQKASPAKTLWKPPVSTQPSSPPSLSSQTHENPINVPAASIDFPPSLQSYVTRCYNLCKSNVEKDQVEIILKGKITSAASSGALQSKNWDTEPLPCNLSDRNGVKPQSPIIVRDFIPLGGRGRGRGGIRGGIGAKANQRRGFVLNSSPSVARPLSHSRSRSRSVSRSRSRSSSRSPYRRRRGSSSESRSRSRSPTPVHKSKKKPRNKKNKKKNAPPHIYSESGMSVGDEDDPHAAQRLQQRLQRFANAGGKKTSAKSRLGAGPRFSKPFILKIDTNGDGEEVDWSSLHIVGTCQDLDKPYLRLTAAPDPSTVRPVPVLLKALEIVKAAWVKSSHYKQACDGLKSIRQDLTVQGVRGSVAIKVYETHARIALEVADHEEFNQCQTQLKALYADHPEAAQNRCEFVAYRILYYIYTSNTLDLNTILATLTKEDKHDLCIAHALALRAAWSLANYVRFFKLYSQSPKMSAYLIDWFVVRERLRGVKTIVKAYRPSVAVSHVWSLLAIPNQEAWLKMTEEWPLTYTDVSRSQIDCKASSAALTPNA